jgi:hypothetical protein
VSLKVIYRLQFFVSGCNKISFPCHCSKIYNDEFLNHDAEESCSTFCLSLQDIIFSTMRHVKDIIVESRRMNYIKSV